jgi:hypothetical protein
MVNNTKLAIVTSNINSVSNTNAREEDGDGEEKSMLDNL